MNTATLINKYNKLYFGTSELTIRQAIAVLNRRRCKIKALRAFYKTKDGFHGRSRKYYLNSFKFDK